MLNRSSLFARALRQVAFPLAGAVFGLTLCALAAAQVSALSPHGALLAHVPDRLYVVFDCSYSKQALELLALQPGAREVLPIAADLASTPARAELCQQALDVLRAKDSLWWSVLPDSYVCGKLAVEARDWMAAQAGEAAPVPAWVVDGALIEPGVGEATLDTLRRHELLANLEFSALTADVKSTER